MACKKKKEDFFSFDFIIALVRVITAGRVVWKQTESTWCMENKEEKRNIVSVESTGDDMI